MIWSELLRWQVRVTGPLPLDTEELETTQKPEGKKFSKFRNFSKDFFSLCELIFKKVQLLKIFVCVFVFQQKVNFNAF